MGGSRQHLVDGAKIRLEDFVELTIPWSPEEWQRLICRRLEMLADQKGQRLLIHGPPQYGKSIIVSQRFPCWMLGRLPEHRIRLTCYNQTHAARFSKVNQELLRSPEFAQVFPDPGCRIPMVAKDDEWSTAARSKKMDAQPSFAALGLGSGFTGLGADLLLVDDPYKNREEAYSEAVNEGIWAWWTDVVIPRLNPDTNVAVMFHRWKEDDLAGRLQAQGGWESLRFPAIADGEADDPTIAAGLRVAGEPLSPRYPVEYLKNEVEAKQGASSFLALYQGRPVPIGGNLFKDWWFENRYKSLPRLIEIWTCWDTALKDKEANDESACVTAGLGEDGKLYILRVVHGHWETPVLAVFLVDQAKWLRERYGDRYLGDYVEDKVSGTTLMQYVRRTDPDLAVIGIPVETDKVARARGVTPLCETERVILPDLTIYPEARQWVGDLLTQLKSFPGGKRDDIVDAFVYALKKLMGTLGRKKGRKGKAGGLV